MENSDYRRRLLILQQISKDCDENQKFDLLEKYYKLENDHITKTKGVTIPLTGDSYLMKEEEYPLDLLQQFEPECHGVYESCKLKESTNLLVLQKNEINNIHENSNTKIKNAIQADNFGNFRTAKEELDLLNNKKNLFCGKRKNNIYNGVSSQNVQDSVCQPDYIKKSLGGRRSVRSNFVLPISKRSKEDQKQALYKDNLINDKSKLDGMTDKKIGNLDEKLIEIIMNEIMHEYHNMDWSEIVGLEYAKSIIQEAVIYPILRPDIFTGIRRPPRAILLFGPPGTGKTLIGKCIASKSKSTFFSISASSLTSKWVGESEKLVRALFSVAAIKQPSVVFIDEIDSLLSQRSETEHESSRRLKTEFLVQLDGAATCNDDRVLLIGATNRPQELDEAARRRFVKRLYIPLPEKRVRIEMLNNVLERVHNTLSGTDIEIIAEKTDGYSGADISSLCQEASMEPIRSIPSNEIESIDVANVRSVNFNDFQLAIRRVRPSVSQLDLKRYVEWNKIYGATQ